MDFPKYNYKMSIFYEKKYILKYIESTKFDMNLIYILTKSNLSVSGEWLSILVMSVLQFKLGFIN